MMVRVSAGSLSRAALSALIVCCALVGPIYAGESLSSVARATITPAPVSQTGMTLTSTAVNGTVETVEEFVPADVARWFDPPVARSSVVVAQYPNTAGAPAGRVEWRDGACEHVEVTEGRCPEGAGEVLLERSLATGLGHSVGTTLEVSEFAGSTAFPDELPVMTLRVVGLYTQRDDPRFWFDERLPTSADAGPSGTSLGTLLTAPPTVSMTGPTAKGTQSRWSGLGHRIDYAYRVDRSAPGDVIAAGQAVRAFAENPGAHVPSGVAGDGSWVKVSSGLPQLADEIAAGRRQALTTIPLLAGALTALVTFVFWLVVRAAAIDLRRDSGVTRLRGQGPRGVRRLVLAELLPPVLVGLPLGLLGAVGLAWWAARFWFEPQPQTTLDTLTILVASGAVLVPPLTTYVVARRASREPVVSLLRAVPPRPRGRSSTVGEVLVATVAVLGFAGVATGSLVGPVALVSPMLLALGAALLAARGTTVAAARLGPTRLVAGHLVSGLALSRVGRRGTARWVVPVVATAAALLVFASCAMTSATSTYTDQALVDVGAPVVLDVDNVPPETLTGAVREADPTGASATPVIILTPSDPGAVATVAVDSRHFGAVAAVPDGVAVSDWQRLEPGPVAPRTLTGQRLEVVLSSSGFVGATGPATVRVALELLRPDSVPITVTLGEIPDRGARLPVVAQVPCAQVCRLVGITLESSIGPPGPGGQLSLLNPTLDGRPVDLGPPAQWLPLATGQPPTLATLSAPTRGRDGLTIDLEFGGRTQVTVQQASVPYLLPAIATPTATNDPRRPTAAAQASTLAGGSRPVDLVATIPYVPGTRARAVVADMTTISGFGWIPRQTLGSHVFLARDDPALVAAVSAALAERGATVVAVHRASDSAQAYARSAPGWALRLGAVLAVAALVVAAAALVAVAGSAAPASRREYAVVQLLGGKRKDVTRVAIGELVPVVTVGVLVGAACGYLAAVVTIGRLPLFVTSPAVAVSRVGAQAVPALLVTAAALVLLLGVATALGRWASRDTSPRRLMEVE